MNNPTTLKYSRTMRLSGTECANAIEHTRKREPRWASIVGAVVMGVMFAAFFAAGV